MKINTDFNYKIYYLIKNMRHFLLVFFLFVAINNLYSDAGAPIDTVYSFKPGTGQSIGQDSTYFPKNIFGPPSTTAREDVPETRPEEMLSLGKDGEIVVGFKGKVLIDIPGPDFTIFENVVKDGVTKKYFAEPGIVSVSEDGVHFYRFPFNPKTLDGLAGKTPTYGDQNPYDPTASGGDSFDIAELGLDYVRYIKIKDSALMVAGLPDSSKYINSTAVISGFDLDAVVGFYVSEGMSSDVKPVAENAGYRDLTGYIVFEDIAEISRVEIFDILGNKAGKINPSRTQTIVKSNYPKGLYIISYEINGKRNVFKSIF